VYHKKISVISVKGFSLIEVMVATATLSLGTVLIYGAFFISLDSFNYYSNYLSVIPWMDEKIWQAQDDLSKFGALTQIGTTDEPRTFDKVRGEFQKAGKTFRWNLNYYPIDDGLYRIDLNLYWQEGQRKVKLLRSAYAIYKEKK
jgi:prepilin-type N-terminal cleavage/methylation domain-containing protein